MWFERYAPKDAPAGSVLTWIDQEKRGHRERPPPQRAASTHRRSERIAGAADRGLPGVAGDLQFDRRVGAGLPGHFGKRNADLRCQIWIAVPDRKWRCHKARASPATLESGEPANSNRPYHPIPPGSPS